MSTDLASQQQQQQQTNSISQTKDTVFTLKRWNLVAVWSWDVECDVCAICRTFLIGNNFFYILKIFQTCNLKIADLKSLYIQ